MSYLGTYLTRFLNSIHNPTVKFNDISEAINTIYPLIKNGFLMFPELNLEFEELVTYIDVITTSILPTISKKISLENRTIKVGYNPLKILTYLQEVDLERILSELPSEQDQLYIQLETTYRRSFKNLFYFKSFEYIYGDVTSKYLLDIMQFQEHDESFCHIFNRDSLPKFEHTHYQQIPTTTWYITHNFDINSSETLDITCYDKEGNIIPDVHSRRSNNDVLILTFKENTSGKAIINRDIRVFPLLFSYITLFRLYGGASKYQYDLMHDINSNQLFGIDYVKTNFNDYITASISSIMDKVISYSLNNIFKFQGIVSPNLISNIRSVLSNHFSDLKTVFSEASDSGDIDLNITPYVIFDCFSNICHITATQNCLEFYYELETFFNFPHGFEWYSQEEELVKNYITDQLKLDVEILKMMEQSAYQFKQTPLYFINSHILIHSKYAQDLISTIGTGFNISIWTDGISLKEDKITTLSEFIQDRGYQRNNDMVQLSIFIRLRDVVVGFCDSDPFKEWVINKFLPNIITVVNSHYIINLEQYTMVDNIISFFKLIFIKDLLERVCFTKYFNEFTIKYNQYLDSAQVGLDDQAIKLLATKFLDYRTSTNLLNSFFKGALMSRYVEGALAPYSI